MLTKMTLETCVIWFALPPHKAQQASTQTPFHPLMAVRQEKLTV